MRRIFSIILIIPFLVAPMGTFAREEIATALSIDSEDGVAQSINTVELVDYYPFGGIRIDGRSGGYLDHYKFTGKELDSETSLYYFEARYQNPGIGRFMSIDPATLVPNEELLTRPQELNSYSYVANNPIRYTDPTGMYSYDVHYDLTLYLAQQAGFSYNQAKVVAYYDQNVDDNPVTSPESNYAGGNRQAVMDYHFASRDDSQQQLNNLINSCTSEDKALQRFGILLHTYQDAYSHEGLTPEDHGKLWIGSKVGLSNNPDDTKSSLDKSIAMSNKSFELLTGLSVNLNNTKQKSMSVKAKTEVKSYLNSGNKSNTGIAMSSSAAKRNETISAPKSVIIKKK